MATCSKVHESLIQSKEVDESKGEFQEIRVHSKGSELDLLIGLVKRVYRLKPY